jgi:polyphosphate kinase
VEDVKARVRKELLEPNLSGASRALERLRVPAEILAQSYLNRRVEVVFPVQDPVLPRHLRVDVLGSYLADNVRARVMKTDGTYQRVRPRSGEGPHDSQLAPLMSRALRRPD